MLLERWLVRLGCDQARVLSTVTSTEPAAFRKDATKLNVCRTDGNGRRITNGSHGRGASFHPIAPPQPLTHAVHDGSGTSIESQLSVALIIRLATHLSMINISYFSIHGSREGNWVRYVLSAWLPAGAGYDQRAVDSTVYRPHSPRLAPPASPPRPGLDFVTDRVKPSQL